MTFFHALVYDGMACLVLMPETLESHWETGATLEQPHKLGLEFWWFLLLWTIFVAHGAGKLSISSEVQRRLSRHMLLY